MGYAFQRTGDLLTCLADPEPDVRVLATSYTPNVEEGKKPAAGGKANIYDIQPQMWTYERTFAKDGDVPDDIGKLFLEVSEFLIGKLTVTISDGFLPFFDDFAGFTGDAHHPDAVL